MSASPLRTVEIARHAGASAVRRTAPGSTDGRLKVGQNTDGASAGTETPSAPSAACKPHRTERVMRAVCHTIPPFVAGPDDTATPPVDDTAGDQPTSLYRYHDGHGVLLYVGITSRGIVRNVEHNLDKEWWQYVASQDVEHYATRREALRRERELIFKHEPPFNRQHNRNHEAARAAYLGLRPHLEVPTATVHDLYGTLGKRLPLTHYEVARRNLVLRSQPAHAEIAANLMLPDWPLRIKDYAGQSLTLHEVERDGRVFYVRFYAGRRDVPLMPAASAFFEINCKMRPKERNGGPAASFPIKAVRVTPRAQRASGAA